MTFYPNTENLSRKVKNAERRASEEYCESKGYTKEETANFVKKTLESLYPEEERQ